MKKAFLFIMLSLLLVLSIGSDLSAATIDITHHNLKRIINGVNPFGWSTVDRIAVTAWVDKTYTDDGITNVYGVYDNQGYTKNLTLSYAGQDIYSNEYNRFGGGMDFDINYTSPWKIIAENGSNKTEVTTHSIQGVETIPFVRNIRVTGGGTTPTVKWDAPDNSENKSLIVVLHDSQGKEFWISDRYAASATEIAIADGLMKEGENYTIRVHVAQREATSEKDVSASNTFVAYTPFEMDGEEEIFLPSVGVDTNPDDNLGAPAYFDVDVTEGSPIFVDPFVSVGYDYRIGEEDPWFESVMLPVMGDNEYQLYLFSTHDNMWNFKTDLRGGELYTFENSGIDYFRILGIETNLGIDPEDFTAFVTQLTFVDSGTFTGSMTPITAWVDPIPEPGTILLLGFGLIGIAGVSRRKK